MRILVVDDDPAIRELLIPFLEGLGHDVGAAGTGAEALEAFEAQPSDLILLDIVLPGIDGLEVLRQIRARSQACEVVMMTAYGSLPTAVQALNMGAYAYVNKPFDMQELIQMVGRVRELTDLRYAYGLLARERLRPNHISNLVSVSPVMLELKERLLELCGSLDSILLNGEAGVGKRFIARILHFNGQVRESLVLQLNVSEIEQWLTQPRFLHSNGMILSSAELPYDLYREGYGTLILNQLNDLDPTMQRSLARLLIERAPHLAPNGDLPGLRIIGLVEINGADLEHTIVPELIDAFQTRLKVPPLRERTECIIPVAQAFFNRYVRETGGRGFYISQPVQEFMLLYQWPGNLRELEYLVNRLSLICTTRLVSAQDLQRVHKELIENREIQDRNLEAMLTLAEKHALSKTFRKKDS